MMPRIFFICLVLLAVVFSGCTVPSQNTGPALPGSNPPSLTPEPSANSGPEQADFEKPAFNPVFTAEIFGNSTSLSIKTFSVETGGWSEKFLNSLSDCYGAVCVSRISVVSAPDSNAKLSVVPVDVNVMDDAREFVFSGEKNVLVVSGANPKKVCSFFYPETQETEFGPFKQDLEKRCNDFNAIEEITGLPLEEKYFLFAAYYTGSDGNYLGSRTILIDGIGRKSFSETLLHELAHSSTRNAALPAWFEEGLSYYVASKILGNRIEYRRQVDEIENWSPSAPQSAIDRGLSYEYAQWLVKKFIEKNGNEKFRVLMHSLENGKDKSNAAFLKKIRETTDPSATLESITHPEP